MDFGLNLLIDPGDDTAFDADRSHRWIRASSLQDGLEQLTDERLHGCVIRAHALGPDALSAVGSIRQVNPRVPVLIGGIEGGTELAAWLLGADGVAEAIDAHVETRLAQLGRQRDERLRGRDTTSDRRVLVVDDDEFLLPALCLVLKRAGFEVRQAHGAAAALEIMHSDDVHVLLTDIMMPGISGTELVAATGAYAPHIVPLVMTGLPRIGSAVESMRAGAQDFLVKPVDWGVLVERVERAWRQWLLGGKTGGAESAKPVMRALLVERDPAYAGRLEGLLGGEVSLTHANRLSTALELFDETLFDVVLLDLNLPDSQGLETFAAFRQASANVPVLALIGSEDPVAEQVVLCGAQDYIRTDDVSGPLLLSRIRYTIERAAMVERLESFALDVRASDVSRRQTIERNNDGVVVLGEDGRVLFLNPAAEALFGVEMDALIGTQFAYSALLDQVVEVQIDRPGDVRFAEVRTVETQWRGVPARLAAIRDVTDQRRSEQKLKQLADQLQTANTRLERLSTHDVLTEVLNRRGLERWLLGVLNRAQREGGHTTALLIDCDKFKAVNNDHGHAAGDRALREVAHRIEAAIRQGDVVGRIGGDEFLVVLPGTHVAEGMLVAERVRLAVADGSLLPADGVELTISVGVAQVPADTRGIEGVLELTRSALHKSKSSGRNRVSGSDPHLLSARPQD